MNGRLRRILALVGLVALASQLAPGAAHAGAANVQLKCKSMKNGKEPLELEGDVPGDMAEFHLRLSANGKTLTFTSDQGDGVGVVDVLKDKVFTVTVLPRDLDAGLKLYAVPSSIRSKRSKDGEGTSATFRAVLVEAPHPWEPAPHYAANMFENVQLQCTYDYSI